MHVRPFGWTAAPVAVIGQGTWQLPRDEHAERAALAALAAGVEQGMNHLDTAEMYGDGRSEEVLARLLKHFRRDALFVVSKVLPSNASYHGTLRACEASLRRLGTDYLDVYLLHWRDDRYPLAETMSALEALVAAGKIRYVGVSNFDVADLRAAQAALTRERIACNQVLYHLGARGIEHDLVPYCRDAGIAVVGYSPFGSGQFPSATSAGGRVLAAVAARHGARPRQVALHFLTRDESVFAIPKAADPAHVAENAGAADLELAAADLDAIDRAFPRPPRGAPLETL
jgi:diketogulonate reductase-like aldo/keto reductase